MASGRSTMGCNIKYYRELKGISQQDLSFDARVSQAMISRLENGTRQECRVSQALAIARALGVTCEQLMQDRCCDAKID